MRPFNVCGATVVATCLFDAPEAEKFAEMFRRQFLARLVVAGSTLSCLDSPVRMTDWKRALSQNLATPIDDQPQRATLVTECQSPTARVLSLSRLAKRCDLPALHPVTGFFDGKVKCFGQNQRVDDELVPASFNFGHVLSCQ